MRRFEPYHEISDDRERREAAVTLHLEGWADKSIARYPEMDRSTVTASGGASRKREKRGSGQAGGPAEGRPKVNLRAMVEARRMQENPELGEFRAQAALEQWAYT